MPRSDEGFVVTDLSSANGTLTSDGSQVFTSGLVLFLRLPTVPSPLQVTKMATGGSVRLRDKSTLFIGDVECALLLTPNPPASAATEPLGAAEVKRHAEVLGIALPSEDGLLWIAEAALKAPLPDHWQKLTDALGRAFYYHATSGR